MHHTAGFKINDLELQQATEDLEVGPDFPQLGGSDIVYEEFAGLTLHKGIYCLEYPKVMGTPGSASVHYSTAHRGFANPKDLPTGYYQQIRKGDDMLVEALHAETDKAFTEVVGTSDLNAHAVTPWLLSTKWHYM